MSKKIGVQGDFQIDNKFQIKKKIGSGSFGEIFLGCNLQTNEEVAIKIENVNSRHPQLLYESKIIRILQGGPGLPRVHWYGIEDGFNVMVMDLLGPSLEDLFNCCNRKLTLKTVLMVAEQLICRVEYVHSKNFLHRDIKPENFLIGTGKRSTLIHIIDFGLGKKYRDPKTHKHIPYIEGKSLTGTARYTSINTHMGIEQSRRDDMEGIGYVLAYFLRGSLPWQGIAANSKQEKYRRIMERKMNTPVETLCRSFPPEFVAYINYCRGLKFEDRPDYGYLRRIFKDLFIRESYEYDYLFDWTLVNFNGMRKRKKVEEETKEPAKRDTSPTREPGKDEEERNIKNVPVKTEKKKKSKCIVF
ncbi:unnamed protein product [Blepharisma stoltei]|uniref:Casein kinase I n=1 Tax=Blepharisma stoltei TaxID=1481888 RepID=A0AAU9I870_9CILI|nr:unnamed protein product [Blepharisma stoltei]